MPKRFIWFIHMHDPITMLFLYPQKKIKLTADQNENWDERKKKPLQLKQKLMTQI